MNREIPQQEKQVGISASDFRPIEENIQAELNSIAQASIVQSQQIITKKLENDDFQFRKLATDSIDQVYEANKTNPEQLKQEFDKISSTLLRGVPFALRNKSQEFLSNNTRAFLSKSKTIELGLLNDQAKANALSELSSIEGVLNVHASDIFSSDPAVSTEAKTVLFDKTQEALNVLSTKLADGTPVFSEVDTFNSMNKLKVNTFSSGMLRQFDGLDSLEKKQEFLQSFIDNKISIPFSNVLTGETQEVLVAEALGFAGYDKAIKKMQTSINRISKQDDDKIWTDYVTRVLDGDAEPDTGSLPYLKGVDEVYTEVAKDLKGTEPIVRANAMMGFMTKTQVASPQMVRDLKVWVNSSDINDFETAVNLINTAKEQFPQLLDKLGQKDFGVALLAADKISSGVNKVTAMESAKRAYDPVTKEITNLRSKRFDDRVREDNVDFDSLVRSSLVLIFKDDFRPGSADTDQASIRYREIMRTQFELSGDWDNAKMVADQFIGRSYKTSVLNNGFLTFMPPENFYGIPNVNSKWMLRDLKADALAQIKASGLNIDPNSVFVSADNTTVRELSVTGQPTWVVMGINSAGQAVPITDLDGKALRWKPDKQKQIEREVEEKQAKFKARLDFDNPLNVVRESIGEFAVKPTVKTIDSLVKEGRKALGPLGSHAVERFIKGPMYIEGLKKGLSKSKKVAKVSLALQANASQAIVNQAVEGANKILSPARKKLEERLEERSNN